MSYTTLVSTNVLADHLDDPDWIVFDCRFTLTAPESGRENYLQEHIKGARYAHLDKDLSSPITSTTGRHPLPDKDKFVQWLRDNGVKNSSQVVVYDESFGAVAGRLWWLLKWAGHDAVALLDGCYPKWCREGNKTSHELPEVVTSDFQAHFRDDLIVTADDLLRSINNKEKIVLIDSRAEERFSGEIEMLDKVAGHIPGAVNFPYDDNLDMGGDFLPTDELKEQFNVLMKGNIPENVIHMCGSGVTACHNMIAMEAAGLAGSKLYVGSWSEWITEPDRPIALGEE